MNIIKLKIEDVAEEISISLHCEHKFYTLWAQANNSSLTFKYTDENKILNYLNTFFNRPFERIGNPYVNEFGIVKTMGYKTTNVNRELQKILSDHFKKLI